MRSTRWSILSKNFLSSRSRLVYWRLTIRSNTSGIVLGDRGVHREQLDNDQFSDSGSIAVGSLFQGVDGGTQRGVGEQSTIPVRRTVDRGHRKARGEAS